MTQTSHADGVSGACPDLDTLADLHADVLDDTTAAALREHIASCSDCTAVMAALDATVTSLGSLPEVEIPADVASRIDSAIAAETGRVDLGSTPPAATPPAAPSSDRRLGTAPNNTAPNNTGPNSTGTPSPDQQGTGNVASLAAHRERKRGFGRGRMLLAAAAAAVVVGGGAIALTQGDGTTANQADQTTQEAPAPDVEERPGEVQAFAAPKDVLEKGAIENEQVSEEIAGKMAEKSARAQCLNQIVPRPASAPEAVQQGTHDGKDAYAFVFPTDDPDIVEMIIVDAADCGTTLDTVTGPRE